MADPRSSSFSDVQYDFCYPLGVEKHWWMLARSAIVAALAREAGDMPALEIGCGNGTTLVMLRAHGLDCHGVEIADVVAREDAREFITTNCDAVDLPEATRRKVKSILLLDVVEHIEEPNTFLRGIAAAFPALQRVVITVPARQEIWSNYDEFYGHYRRYDVKALRALGETQGWRVNYLGYAFRISYLPARVLAALKIPRKVKLTGPTGHFATTLHRVLAALTLLEWRILPAGVPGTSIVATFDV